MHRFQYAFHSYKKLSKQKGAILTVLRLRSDGKIVEAALQPDGMGMAFAKKSLQLQQGTSNAQHLDQGSS